VCRALVARPSQVSLQCSAQLSTLAQLEASLPPPARARAPHHAHVPVRCAQACSPAAQSQRVSVYCSPWPTTASSTEQLVFPLRWRARRGAVIEALRCAKSTPRWRAAEHARRGGRARTWRVAPLPPPPLLQSRRRQRWGWGWCGVRREPVCASEPWMFYLLLYSLLPLPLMRLAYNLHQQVIFCNSGRYTYKHQNKTINRLI